MQLLYWLESLRNPALDAFFSLITHLGSETLFIAIAIVVFWCVGKKQGYYLMTVGFFGTVINQFLKLMFRIPRPWVRDPAFTIVESAREAATGYSFPSGHTQNAVSILGCPARFGKNKLLRIVCVALILLTGLSRMYLGVHTPADVGVSLLVGAFLVFVLYPFFERGDEKPLRMYVAMGALTVCALLYVLFVELHAWPANIDEHNLASGIKNGYLVLGCGCGMLLSCLIERKWINFGVKAPLAAQIAKVVLGLGLVLALKAGLKPVCVAVCGGHAAATALRYFLLVLFAACVWPLTFPWFAKGCPMKKWVKKTLVTVGCIIVALALLGGYLFWEVTRDTKRAPIASDNAENTLITPLGVTMLSGHRAGGGIA
ncbi:MAG: phosphatase PAP2 family protein, partial [Oscillospiraceae bacterium]|nr:phosphatase PAP2 family protein [Oscillospiraceae bacterium]